VQLVDEEQGAGTVSNPPLVARDLPRNAGSTVTMPYTRAIAVSEPVLRVDGERYYDSVASADIVRRLVHLLSATDSETRMGSSMVLTKLCESESRHLFRCRVVVCAWGGCCSQRGVACCWRPQLRHIVFAGAITVVITLPTLPCPTDGLQEQVIAACRMRPMVFDSLVGSIEREEPVASVSAMMLLRCMLGELLREGVLGHTSASRSCPRPLITHRPSSLTTHHASLIVIVHHPQLMFRLTRAHYRNAVRACMTLIPAAHESSRASLLRTSLVSSLVEVCHKYTRGSLPFLLACHSLIAFAFPCAHGPSQVGAVTAVLLCVHPDVVPCECLSLPPYCEHELCVSLCLFRCSLALVL
jgi:hypothetical protein